MPNLTPVCCPLCGSERFHADLEDEFVICAGCAEILRPSELVSKATRRTRRVYERNQR